MKTFFVLILLAGAGYLGYTRFTADDDAAPDVIENPVYADVRLDMRVGGRDLQFALFGRMAIPEDCERRTDSV